MIKSYRYRHSGLRFLAGVLAVCAIAPYSLATPGAKDPGLRKQGARRSIDPPVRAVGRLGQDVFLALDHRDLASLGRLLKQGADPNARNGLEFTPLAIAAAMHQPEAMKMLLAAGAEPDAMSTYGSPLTFAASSAHVTGAKLLLNKKVDVNATRSDGVSVLMMAAITGAPEMVSLLIAHKADVKARNEHGVSALALAARGGNDRAGQLLIEAGATINEADDDGITPLMAAAMNGRTTFVKMLLAAKANPNARDAKGQTALMLAAARTDNGEVAKALLVAGAKPALKDKSGMTAAQYANARGHSSVANALNAPDFEETLPTPEAAVSKSLRLLGASMAQFGKSTNCISCHHEGLGRMTSAAALKRGLKVPTMVQQIGIARVRGAANAMRPLHEAALKSPEAMKQVPLIEINEVSTGYVWLLGGMAMNNDAPTQATAAMAQVLARQQSKDGSWGFTVPRPPMQSTPITYTALAIRSLKAYGAKSAAAENEERIAKARAWLAEVPAATTEERVFKLLGLKWAGGASDSELLSLADRVLELQREDSGWSQLPTMESDAYATGMALYALRESGAYNKDSIPYRFGVNYLLRTQESDGSWFVNKRTIPANNFFDGGFPHGESQYASFNGTCWATLALLEAVTPKPKADVSTRVK